MKATILSVAAVVFFSSVPLVTSAQLLFESDSNIEITVSPEHPAPGQRILLRANSLSFDLGSADISWSVNGKKSVEGVGEVSFPLTLGENGKSYTITVEAMYQGQEAKGTKTVAAHSVDLLYDAVSYVHPFYKGRSLASHASPLRFEAVPHILSGGAEIAPHLLLYTWKQNGRVLGSLSGSGKSKAVIQPPPLFGSNEISVEVRTKDGAHSAQTSLLIPAIDPGVTLYQDHPLFGVTYYRAIKPSDTISDFETSLIAIPYYIGGSPDDASLTYAWRINGKQIDSATSSSRILSISAKGVSDATHFELDLSSSRDFALSAQGKWDITFDKASDVRGGQQSATEPSSVFETQ